MQPQNIQNWRKGRNFFAINCLSGHVLRETGRSSLSAWKVDLILFHFYFSVFQKVCRCFVAWLIAAQNIPLICFWSSEFTYQWKVLKGREWYHKILTWPVPNVSFRNGYCLTRNMATYSLSTEKCKKGVWALTMFCTTVEQGNFAVVVRESLFLTLAQ